MHYIDVRWLHDHADEPIRLVSELDDQRCEVRKLEFFRNGEVGYASDAIALLGTRLSEVSVPLLDEINADPQFSGVTIEAAAFELLWKRHATGAPNLA